MNRFYVEKCENGGTLDSGKEITWAVMDRVTGSTVDDCDTRKEARDRCRERNTDEFLKLREDPNAETGCACIQKAASDGA